MVIFISLSFCLFVLAGLRHFFVQRSFKHFKLVLSLFLFIFKSSYFNNFICSSFLFVPVYIVDVVNVILNKFHSNLPLLTSVLAD